MAPPLLFPDSEQKLKKKKTNLLKTREARCLIKRSLIYVNNKEAGLGVTCSPLPSPRVSLTSAKKQTVMLEEYKTRA